MEINIIFLNGPEVKIYPQVGPQGAQGIQGPKGETGQQGPKGDKGPAGKSAYESAQAGGYSKTEAQFEADLGAIADTVKVTSQTWSAEQKAQARSNIDAANAKHYKDNGIEIVSDGAGNIDPDNMSIVLCAGDQYSVMEYNAVASIILGPGRFNCRNALALGGNSIFLDSMFTDHPWLQQYCEPYPLEQYPNAYRMDAAIDQKKVGNVVIGTCRSTNFGFMYGNMCVATGGWGFTAGQYNYNKHNMCALFGNALISGNHSSLVCGRWNNPLLTDRFEVGNGTGVNSRSNAFRVTNDGKAIAQTVLAIDDGNGGLIELSREQLQAVINAVTMTAVEGTTPTITALPGVRYVCGEVATLDITLPASGVVDVTFESGSTATVLTITPPTGVTVRWANGFDPDNLAANTSYEIRVTDGKFGSATIYGTQQTGFELIEEIVIADNTTVINRLYSEGYRDILITTSFLSSSLTGWKSFSFRTGTSGYPGQVFNTNKKYNFIKASMDAGNPSVITAQMKEISNSAVTYSLADCNVLLSNQYPITGFTWRADSGEKFPSGETIYVYGIKA